MNRRLALAVCCLVASSCAAVESRSYAFATLAEAREAGAIEQGWVPRGLPSGTRDLRVGYVPRTAERWGLGSFPPAEGESLRALLEPEEMPLDGHAPGAPARLEWWPVILRGSLDGERIAATGLRAYRARNQGLIVAVNWQQGRFYYWSAR